MLEVKVVEDGRTYSSLGTGQEQLRRLDGTREMDWGYDVRDGLYVSHFWNGTSKLIIKLESPKILNQAPRVALLGEQYDFTAFASMADSGENVWALSAPQIPLVADHEPHRALNASSPGPRPSWAGTMFL